MPENTGWIPSVSTGWGVTTFVTPVGTGNTSKQQANSWYLGLQWADAFIKGNDAGMALGQAPFATSTGGLQPAQDSNYMWEWWYKFQVTDNISVTPAIFYINNYDGQNGKGADFNQVSKSFGGLLKTTFKF